MFKRKELKYLPSRIWQTISLMARSHRIFKGKYIWKAHELKFADQFKELAPLLIKEFLTAHPDFSGLVAETKSNPNGDAHLYVGGDKWKVVAFRYIHKWMLEPGFEEKYPTAIQLVKMLEEYCPIAEYSILEPGGEITVHSGIENRYSEYLRYHVPLIIPEGNVDQLGFECMGELIDWSDVWAFDNQGMHTAWNRTDKHRLIFLIDVHRSIAGVPPSNIPHIKDKDLESAILLMIRKIKWMWYNLTGKNEHNVKLP